MSFAFYFLNRIASQTLVFWHRNIERLFLPWKRNVLSRHARNGVNLLHRYLHESLLVLVYSYESVFALGDCSFKVLDL